MQVRLASEQQQQQQLSHHKPGVAEMELDSLSITRGEEALPSLRTGDLVLFQSESFTAKFFQHALKAK